MLTDREVLSTINMLRSEHLDVRTVTMGINLFDCASSDFDTFAYKVRSKIFRYAEKLVETCDLVGDRYGIPVVNKRISVSPIGTVGASFSRDEMVAACRVLDESAKEVGGDFIGGFGALQSMWARRRPASTWMPYASWASAFWTWRKQLATATQSAAPSSLSSAIFRRTCHLWQVPIWASANPMW